MKDAYSFDRTRRRQGQLPGHGQAYRRIFDRFGLTYRAVAADSGAIGGDLSEEFQVIAATGEDAIVYCPSSDYAANMEKAEALAPLPGAPCRGAAHGQGTPTPGKSTCADVASCWACRCKTTVKSLVLATDENWAAGEVVKTQVWLLLLRGDHDMNEVKVARCRGWRASALPPWPRSKSISAASPAIWAPSA
jgi:prolyl-tRNA synthetase